MNLLHLFIYLLFISRWVHFSSPEERTLVIKLNTDIIYDDFRMALALSAMALLCILMIRYRETFPVLELMELLVNDIKEILSALVVRFLPRKAMDNHPINQDSLLLIDHEKKIK